MGCARNVSVQKFRDGAWTFLAQPHTDEGSEHTLHLLLQESITPHDESDSETDLLDLEGEYVLYSRLKGNAYFLIRHVYREQPAAYATILR